MMMMRNALPYATLAVASLTLISCVPAWAPAVLQPATPTPAQATVSPAPAVPQATPVLPSVFPSETPTPPTDTPTFPPTPLVRPQAPAAAPQTAPVPAPRSTAAARTGTAEILVLGDSQISFGAGGAYQKFFANLGAACPSIPARFQTTKAAAIGVRSTALHHWTATEGRARGVICDIDAKHGVNAGAYGVTSTGRTYVQIGQNPAYPFCKANRTPLKAVFEAPAYDPDLVVLAFLGNASERWQSPTTATADWQAAARDLPADVACIVMTTIPAFDASTNQPRRTAQSNLQKAVAADGRCAFVAGITAQTLAEFQGNTSHFRTDADGTMVDPNHPTAASSALFTQLQTPALCTALTRVLPQ